MTLLFYNLNNMQTITGMSLRFMRISQSTKLEKQGCKKKILEKAFVKFYRSHYDELRKYGASITGLKEP